MIINPILLKSYIGCTRMNNINKTHFRQLNSLDHNAFDFYLNHILLGTDICTVMYGDVLCVEIV